MLVDDLQKVRDAELGDAPREARQIGEHHRPAFAEQVPNAPVDRLDVCVGRRSQLDQNATASLRLRRLPIAYKETIRFRMRAAPQKQSV